ncbi:MAG: glycosyltransferase [Clostridia bacterium]|nr:glycosyltransferase [Clostridia bacterium]
MNKLKIIEAMDVYLPDVDGVINCVNNYSVNLADRTDLTVICPKNKKSYVDNFPYKVVRCKSVHIPILNQYYGFPNSDRKFKKTIMEADCDIIHLHSPFGMAKFAVKVAKKKNIPLVATFHSNMRQIFESIFKSKSFSNMLCKKLGKIYNQCDEVFVCSPVVEEQLRSYGYTGKVSYLPFGTDFKKCENVEENSVLANKEFGIKERELVFIYVGRVMKLKRIDFILDSLKILKDKGVKFKFFIVGKGAELNKLKKHAKKLGFTDDEVIFTGFLAREKFPLLFSRADLLLFPSVYDNFGLVKVEGASYETPGVFVKGTCAGYDIQHGFNGFLSENDTESFANAIIDAVRDYDKLKQIGKNAKDTVYISWKDCTDRLLETYERIIKEHKSKQVPQNKADKG